MFQSIQSMRRRKEEAEVSITPLIDMVFILLIFFLVTASFVPQTGMEIQKPSAATAEELDKGALIVGIDAAGTLTVSGRKVNMSVLGQIVSDRFAGDQDLSVLLLADRQTSADVIINVMDEIKKTGVEQFALGAKKTDEY